MNNGRISLRLLFQFILHISRRNREEFSVGDDVLHYPVHGFDVGGDHLVEGGVGAFFVGLLYSEEIAVEGGGWVKMGVLRASARRLMWQMMPS